MAKRISFFHTMPSVKDSFSSRVCLRTDTVADSYVMVDRKGAEKLGKKGMLYYVDGTSQTPYAFRQGQFFFVHFTFSSLVIH